MAPEEIATRSAAAVVLASGAGTRVGAGVNKVYLPLAGRLLAAYEEAAREGFAGTDTASVMERFAGLPVHWVPGAPENIKVTYPHDLVVAGQIRAG